MSTPTAWATPGPSTWLPKRTARIEPVDLSLKPYLVITARCGHRFSTNVRRCCTDDLCRVLEKHLDYHERLCTDGSR